MGEYYVAQRGIPAGNVIRLRTTSDETIERGAYLASIQRPIAVALWRGNLMDRVLYLAGGRFRVGAPDEVLRSEVLSELYDSPVDVVRTRGRIIIAGAPDQSHHHHRHGVL